MSANSSSPAKPLEETIRVGVTLAIQPLRHIHDHLVGDTLQPSVATDAEVVLQHDPINTDLVTHDGVQLTNTLRVGFCPLPLTFLF